MVNNTLVILPTYNERANLKRLVEELTELHDDIDILIVDDNSPDGTGEIAESLKSEKIHVLHRSQKAGLGPAYLAGFSWASSRQTSDINQYEFLVEMDADGSHHPAQLGELLGAAKAGYDLVIGTRWMTGGSVHNWPLARRLISRFGTWYASAALKLPYKDLTSGFRVLRMKLVKEILKSDLEASGYGFQIEVVALAARHGMSITQVPIEFTERVDGQSKMNTGIVFEAWLKTTQWGFKRILNRR
jgi:dolichol-phosphate mannosyltransferase